MMESTDMIETLNITLQVANQVLSCYYFDYISVANLTLGFRSFYLCCANWKDTTYCVEHGL